MHATPVLSPTYKGEPESNTPSEQSQKNDRVTIGFYGLERDIGAFIRSVTKELNNIKILNQQFASSASRFGRPPPEIVLSVSIIPDWENNSSYSNEEYKIRKEQALKMLNELIKGDSDLKDIKLEDFYENETLDDAERAYLQNLEAKGSNADMIKTHAIIADENSARRHLQMDSNTKILNYDALYAETFGSQEQRDALNASYYDQNYVSAHNKIVYTTPGGKLAPTLKAIHLEYCDQHKNDQGDEKKTKNSIYSKDFVVALEKLQLTTKRSIEVRNTSTAVKHVYPANINNPEYRITNCILTAVNMSWRNSSHMSKLNELPSFRIGDAQCDYASFRNMVKKYTSPLNGHVPENCNDEREQVKIEEETFKALMQISNQPLEKEVVRQFTENVAKNDIVLLEDVLAEFPKTPIGEEFFKSIFNCTATEYLAKKQEEHQTSAMRPK